MERKRDNHNPVNAAGKTVLELEMVALDPVLSGFVGAILELSEQEDTYTLLELSAGTGDEILKVTSSNEKYIRAYFEHELEEFKRLADFYTPPIPPIPPHQGSTPNQQKRGQT